MTDYPITPPQWQMDAWQACIETMGADVPAILLEAAKWGYEQHEKELLDAMHATVPQPYEPKA